MELKGTAAVLGYLQAALWGNATGAGGGGVHPRQEQSGQPDRSCLSNQGHACLRRSLSIVALVARRHDPTLRAFSDRLRAAAHAKPDVLCAVMHTLLRPLMGILPRDQRANDTQFRPLAA